MMTVVNGNDGLRVISKSDLEQAWESNFSPWLSERLSQIDLRYAELSETDFSSAVIDILEVLNSDLGQAGEHRLPIWEAGWGENRENYLLHGNSGALIPGYFGKFSLVRWKQKLIAPNSEKMEYDLLGFLLDWVFDTYLDGSKVIYEFGCGTGHNLVRARARHQDAVLWGLDWAEESQRLIEAYAEENDNKLFARNFDYFNPDFTFKLESGSKVITVASLEQTGDRYKDFVAYLLAQPVDVVLHIEPVGEVLDSTNLLDYLSIQYFRKRGYLDGLLNHLRELEQEGELEILAARRTYVGSFFIDGYTLIAWRPRM
jgi:hypothetical protein